MRDRFEVTDGSSPESVPLAAEVARRIPLAAFGVLEGGDAFEVIGGKPPPEGPARARAYTDQKLVVLPHGASSRPTLTCPPRATVASINGRMSTPNPATIQGAVGARLFSKARCASRCAARGGNPHANSSENMNR